MQLLKLMSLDGQYAIIQAIGTVAHQKDMLEPMYAVIEGQDADSAVSELYRYFGELATRSEFEMSGHSE